MNYDEELYEKETAHLKDVKFINNIKVDNKQTIENLIKGKDEYIEALEIKNKALEERLKEFYLSSKFAGNNKAVESSETKIDDNIYTLDGEVDILTALQENLPWTLPYLDGISIGDDEFALHKHALLHVMKAVGRLSAAHEKWDHGRKIGDKTEEIDFQIANLMIGAIRLANLYNVQLLDVVIKQLEEKNNIKFKIIGGE